MARVLARLFCVAAVLGGLFAAPRSARADFAIDFYDLTIQQPGGTLTGPFSTINSSFHLTSANGFIFQPTLTVGSFTINTIIGRSYETIVPTPFLGIQYSAGQIFLNNSANASHVLAVIAYNTNLTIPGNSTATLTWRNNIAGNLIVSPGTVNFNYRGFASSTNASPGVFPFPLPSVTGNITSFNTDIGTLAGTSNANYALTGPNVDMLRNGSYSMGTLFFVQLTAGARLQVNNETEVIDFMNGPEVAVPEPSSVLLAFVGSCVVVGYRRFRQGRRATAATAT